MELSPLNQLPSMVIIGFGSNVTMHRTISINSSVFPLVPIKQVHDKFDLMGETLFLTVNIIDRFLSKQTVVRKRLQLVGLVAMLLASKYEEVSVPIVGDLILISDKAYNRKELLEMVIMSKFHIVLAN